MEPPAGPAWARPPESIHSGLSLEELRTGSQRAARAREELARLGAPRQEPRSAGVKLMLAETAERPFTDPAWIFELKHDGRRGRAASRHRHDEPPPAPVLTQKPDLVTALAAVFRLGSKVGRALSPGRSG